MIEEDGIGEGDEEAHNDGSSEFDNDDEDGLDIPLLEKANEPLYEGSQTTLLSAIVLLVNLKVMNGISNVAMSRMLRLISEFLLPPSNILPRSYRELSNIMNQIGMKYQTIHACPNDHILYHKQHEFATECPDCHISRYQSDQITKKVPHKVLRYIPIIPRLQRLFRCASLAQFMDYHARNRSQDDIMRMPADGSAFKEIEETWSHFKEEPRNLKLSLAVDGVNPYGDMRSVYSVWPIFVINNNIPPWMSIKREHIMLSMIVPGNNAFFDHLFHMSLKLFGPTIRKRWNVQAVELKNQLIASFEEKFGKNIFDTSLLLKRTSKHIKTVRDQYRRALKENPKYDCPPMIPPMEWNEIIEDAKEKRLCENTVNEVAQGKKRLQDTSVATKARLQKVGQHKLGSGGYMNLQSRLGIEFNVELTDEDRKIALKEGYKVVAARLRNESESLAQESSAPNDISQPSYPITEPARDEGHDVHYSGGEHVEHHGEGVEHVPSVQHVDVAADQNVNVHDVALSEPPLVQPPPAPPKRRSHRNLTLHVPEEEEIEGDMDAPMNTFLMRAKKNKKKK